jgi:hypothetical protein
MTPKRFIATVAKLRPGDLIMITDTEGTISLGIYSHHTEVHMSCTWTAQPHRDYTSQSSHRHCKPIASIKLLKRETSS